MQTDKLFFWIFALTIVYTYFGYAVLIVVLSLFKKVRSNQAPAAAQKDWPEVSLVVAAYNEKPVLADKVNNCFESDYPKDKLKVIFVTDGSDDGSDELLRQYPGVTVFHERERKGKTAAINRIMPFIQSPVVVFSDANTLINKEAVRILVSAFDDPSAGCVAGEKRVHRKTSDKAVSSGESFYWNYESMIKRYESLVNSSIGAAGELYAIRTSMFRPVPADSLLDDFVISILIAKQGYKIKYASSAYSVEHGSASMHDEMKRKTRIATGCFQTLFRYPFLFNFFRHGWLSFQYVSHKVLRWIVVPFAFPVVLLANICISTGHPGELFYSTLLFLQLVFYVLVLIGFLFRKKELPVKILFLPYYLISMNIGLVAGLFRYIGGGYSAAWEKVARNA